MSRNCGGQPAMRPPVPMPVRRRRGAVLSVSSCLHPATAMAFSAPANAATEELKHITQQKAMHNPRRTRRTNYADREHLQFPAQFTDVPRGLSAEASFAATPSFFASRGHSDTGLYRNGLFLRALVTPVIGRVAYGTLVAMAYIGYGIGRVALYKRHSTAPPLCNKSSSAFCAQETMQQLIEMGAFYQAAESLTHVTNNDKNNNNDSGSSRSGDSSRDSIFRGILHGSALDCVHIGRSHIHSRGLFTDCDLPRGTRVVTEAQRSFVDAAGFIRLLADTHSKLPDTWHYTHPSGALLELVTQPQPHHLINHSCDANLCAGLSSEFWPAAKMSGNAALLERIKDFKNFDDANSFFTTRDVRAGEELTINYANRVAPLFSGENSMGSLFVVCHCGSPECQHFLYRSAVEPSRLAAARAQSSEEAQLAQLFGAGLDDETVALSLLSSRKPLLEYMRRNLSESQRRTTKRELLGSSLSLVEPMNSSTSAEPSIIIEESKSTGSSPHSDSQRDDHQFKKNQNSSEGYHENGKNNISMMSELHCEGSAASNVEDHKNIGLPPIPSRASQRDVVGSLSRDPAPNSNDLAHTNESGLDDVTGVSLGGDDEMADRVLHILERKDALLAEQALCLQHRDAEFAELRRELNSLREEKRLLLQQFRGLVTGNSEGSEEDGSKNGDTSNSSPLVLLQRAELALRDERAGRQGDANRFRAHIAQLTAQLDAARRDVAERERMYAKDLATMQHEMSALAGHVNDARALQAALRRAESEAATAAASRHACAAEREQQVRELQHALRRERAERESEVAALRRAHEADRESSVADGGRLRANVEQCVRGTERVEQCLREATAREAAALDALEAARAEASRVAAASRAERLEQQRLAADMQAFYRTRLEALQESAQASRERAEALERDAAVAQAARAALEEALQRAREHGEEMANMADELRSRAARAEAERSEWQRTAAEQMEQMARHEASQATLRAHLERERERVKEKEVELGHAEELAKERERAKEKEKVKGRPDGWRERLQGLEHQLRTARDERGAVERRGSDAVAVLERQHRESLRQLENTLRRRLAELESATRETAERREAANAEARQSGTTRVVADLMAFVRAVEAFAEKRAMPLRAQSPEADKESEVLRAACDDIARGYLGIEGGWEALRQPTHDTQRKEGQSGQIPAATRQRVRRLLAAHVEAQFRVDEERKGEAEEKQKESGVSERGGRIAGRSAVGEQPIRELLMECVHCAFGVEGTDEGGDLHEDIHGW